MENLKFGNLWGRIESASVWSDIQLMLGWSLVNVLKYKEKNLNFFLITLFLKTQILEYVKGNKLQCISTSNNIWKAILIFFIFLDFNPWRRIFSICTIRQYFFKNINTKPFPLIYLYFSRSMSILVYYLWVAQCLKIFPNFNYIGGI